MNDTLSNDTLSQVELIREVFHYQSRFEGSTMVFKIDYPVTETPGFPGLVKDLALLAKTGFKIVIVPGSKENIDKVLKQHGIDSSNYYSDNESSIYNSPIRITTKQAIPYVEMAAFDAASKFMTFLSGSRVEAVIGNFVRARGLGVINGTDTEHTGVVDKVYTDSLSRVMNLGMIPILPCIGWSPSGKPYNVSSDEITLAVSTALGAKKLFIVTMQNEAGEKTLNIPVELEKRQDGSLMRLTPAQTEAIINANIGLRDEAEIRKIREFKLALKASKAGVHRIHIIEGNKEGAILKELFSNLGAGIMINTDEYESIRAFRSKDLPDILRLMEPFMQTGSLVRRNPEQIQEKKADYSVLEIDGSICACGALHDWGESQGEIAAVATDPQYTHFGLGRQMVDYLIEKAKKSRMSRVFVLTTCTQDWFESLGFKETTVESLPGQKRKVYDQNRNSKVYALEFNTPDMPSSDPKK